MEVEVLRYRGGRYIGRERVWTDGLTLVSTLSCDYHFCFLVYGFYAVVPFYSFIAFFVCLCDGVVLYIVVVEPVCMALQGIWEWSCEGLVKASSPTR